VWTYRFGCIERAFAGCRGGRRGPNQTDEATRDTPLVCGDINDGPGLDASEKRFFGSRIGRLIGTVWKPEMCLRNALFDSRTLSLTIPGTGSG